MTEKRKEQFRLGSKRYRERHPERITEYNKTKRPKYISKKTRYMKILREERGNKCLMCGYDEETRILHFHHLRDKKFELSQCKKSLEEMRNESEKCILLCPNCHALIHLKK